MTVTEYRRIRQLIGMLRRGDYLKLSRRNEIADTMQNLLTAHSTLTTVVERAIDNESENSDD